MSHLHVPDGVLPAWLWIGGLVLALLPLAWPSGAGDASSARARRAIATKGALGALVLVAMTLPLGPLDLHVTLAGPVGILLGARASFEVGFVVSAILALMGHGGITVVGLNALVFGIAAASAGPLYAMLARRLGPAAAMAWATAAGQALAGLSWLGLTLAGIEGHGGHETGAHAGRLAAFGLPLWAVGIVAESLVAFGIGRFLARVHPALLPGGRPEPASGTTRPAPHPGPAGRVAR
jgi:cobalt/nickel transport system permease protein